MLSEGGTVVDAYPVSTGFRKTAFRGGASGGGVSVNDRYLFLTGYAIRSTNEWAVIGGAVPEWMTFVNTEAGINRVFLRAGRTAGALTLRAAAGGLTAATATITSLPFPTTGGLVAFAPVPGGAVSGRAPAPRTGSAAG